MNRVTPIWIRSLKPDQIFVFGSNLKGQHGGGAAKTARTWGAKWGKGIGRSGQTYAIPTKYDYIRSLPVEEIKPFIDQFILYAKDHPELIFLVTPIGCGLANHDPSDIAPFFRGALKLKNVYLPDKFLKILNKK